MCQKYGLWLGLISLLLTVSVGCGRRSTAGQPEAADKTTAAPEVLVKRPVVKTVTDYEDFTGYTEAVMDVEVRARVSGYLVEGLKDGGPNREGTEVKKGDLLFEIDPRTYEADQAKAEAALRRARRMWSGWPRTSSAPRNSCRRARLLRGTTIRSLATTRRRSPQ